MGLRPDQIDLPPQSAAARADATRPRARGWGSLSLGPLAAEAASRARAMELETLPRWARTEVVQLAANYRALPLVSRGTLAALHDLRLPIGRLKECTVEEAVRQAHALRRAWDLGTLGLSRSNVMDVAALAGCAALRTLYLSRCTGLTDRWRAARRCARSTCRTLQ